MLHASVNVCTSFCVGVVYSVSTHLRQAFVIGAEAFDVRSLQVFPRQEQT